MNYIKAKIQFYKIKHSYILKNLEKLVQILAGTTSYGNTRKNGNPYTYNQIIQYP